MDSFDRAGLRRSHPVLDLGEDLLDGVEIWRIGRQKRELCASIEDRCSNRLGAVASQIIEDNDVAWPQRGDQELLDVGAENHSVDRAIDDARLGQSIDPEGGEKRQRVPAPIGSTTSVMSLPHNAN